MARAKFSIVAEDTHGEIQGARTVTFYETDGTTPLAQSIYAAASGGIATTTHITSATTGTLDRFVDTPQRVKYTVSGQSGQFDGGFAPDESDTVLKTATQTLTNKIYHGVVYDVGGRVYNVKAAPYGAVGNGVANDAAAIDAAWAAAIAAGGGTVYLPRGSYLYAGTGLINNPANGVNVPMRIIGDGPGASSLSFTSVSNADAIKLSSQSAIGSGVCWGSSVEDLFVSSPATVNAITISNIERWRVSGVGVGTCKTALKISNTRFGRAQDLYLYDWREHGISINEGLTGLIYDDTWLQDIEISGAGNATTGWGISMMLGAAPTGSNGTFLKHVIVNYGSQGGARFGTTAPGGYWPIFIFAVGLVCDYASFTQPAIQIVNADSVFFSDCWAFGARVGGSTVEFDKSTFSWVGGFASNGHVTPAGGGSVFDLKNGVKNSVLHPSGITANVGAGVTAVANSAGAVPTSLDWQSGFMTGVGATHATNIVGAAGDLPRLAGATTIITSDQTAYGWLGLIDRADPSQTNARGLRIDPATGNLQFLNAARAAMATMTSAGALTAVGDVRGKRIRATGTALVAGDVAISAGWGNTAVKTVQSGTDQAGWITVLCQGTGIVASPTITLTFHDGTWTSLPFPIAIRDDVVAPAANWNISALTATAVTWTFGGTPVSGSTYSMRFIMMGGA